MRLLHRLCTVRAMVLSAGVLWAAPLLGTAPLAGGKIVVHCIDVGQGDCTLIDAGEGVVLIDAGGDSAHTEALVAYLKKFFSTRPGLANTIRAVYITHCHKDHTLALDEIMANFKVESVIDNGQRDNNQGGKNQRDVEAGLAPPMSAGVRIFGYDDAGVGAATGGKGLTDEHIDPFPGAPDIFLLSAGYREDPGWPSGDFEDPNNHSLVIRVEFGASSFLFSGDLETHAIGTLLGDYQGGNALNVDVYHVGHHGSNNATTEEFLDAMSPQIAVISMGSFGSAGAFGYGHPSAATLELLRNAIPGKRGKAVHIMAGHGSRKFEPYTVTKRIYGTGWDGNITITADEDRTYRTRTKN